MSNKPHLKSLGVLFLVVFVALAIGQPKLSSAGSSAKELTEKQVLEIAHIATDLNTLDPAFCSSLTCMPMVDSIYDALLRYPTGTGDYEHLEGALAKDWEVSEDGLTWTFYLRKGVMFHKGYGELTAEDVKFSYERLADPKLGSTLGASYKNIKNVEVVDKYTAKFHLKKLDAFFKTKVLNYHAAYIVSKKAYQEMGPQKFAFNPIGTGPFQFKKYYPGDKLEVTRFEDYWKGKPILEKVVWYFMPDLSSRTIALKKGDVQAIYGTLDPSWVKNLQGTKGIVVDALGGHGTPGMLFFNMTVKPLNNLKVRQAIAYAINREEVSEFYGLLGSPLYSFGPIWAYGGLTKEEVPEELRYTYNPEKAKELLRQAGYPNGFTLNTPITSQRNYLDPFEIVQKQLAEVGIDLKFDIVEHGTFHKMIRDDLGSIVPYLARRPLSYVYLFQFLHSDSIVTKPTGITNFSHYGDILPPGIDKYLDECRSTVDQKMQLELLKQAQLQALKDLPGYPWVERSCVVLARRATVDLGYKFKSTSMYQYYVRENTKIVKE